jgi:hypothetical protein
VSMCVPFICKFCVLKLCMWSLSVVSCVACLACVVQFQVWFVGSCRLDAFCKAQTGS